MGEVYIFCWLLSCVLASFLLVSGQKAWRWIPNLSSGGAGKCWCVVCSVWCVRFVMLASCWCAETGDPSAGTELAAVRTGNELAKALNSC